jgi:hypothetical protein
MATKPEQIRNQRHIVHIDGRAIKQATHRFERRVVRAALRTDDLDSILIPSRVTKGWAA